MSKTRKVHYFDGPCQEWIELRANYITATQISMLFQMGGKSVAALVEEKLYGAKLITNEYMTIGQILEPAVLQALKVRCNLDAKPLENDKIVMITDDEYRISATPDGIIRDGDKRTLVECKTTLRHFDKWKDAVPENYLLQVHTQLLMTGIKEAYIACMQYEYPLPFIVYKVHYCPEIAEILKTEAKRFWKCMDTNTAFRVNNDKKLYLRNNMQKTAELFFLHDK